MSEIKKRRDYISIGSFKLNRISLLNQSNLNTSFEKLNIPKSKLVINNTTMPFNIFFNPVRNIDSISKNRENNNKINPLTEKNKIIRKHNILQKIDFNINLIRNNKKENKKNSINLSNNINDNIHDRLSLHINRITTNFHNSYKKNTNDSNLNKTLNLHLPFLTHIKENLNKNNSKSNLYNNINLPKYINNSFLFNNWKNGNIISPPKKSINNLKKYSKIFTNDKIKKTYSQNLKKLKVNYTEHSMLKELNNLILNEHDEKDKKTKNDKNINLNNKNEELKISVQNNKNNDESDKNDNNDKNDDNNNSSKDSKDDICDINEIEKIISKSSYNIYPHNNNNKNSINDNNTNYLLNKSGNEPQNKKHMFLNSLYRMQKINDNQFFEHNKTSFNNYMNMKNKSSIKSNKVSQGTNTENRMDYLTSDMTSNIFNQNQTYFENDDNLYINEKNKNKKDLMSYNFKKKIIKNNRTFNFHTSDNHSK